MKTAFLHQLEASGIETGKHQLLAAVSGGPDSMVLCNLLLACKADFAVAHVNHGLRGAESDEEAVFVETWCRKNKIRFHLFDCGEILRQSVSGIQEKARELRYAFLEKTAEENAYDFILTAHHHDDRIETFFMHLMRGAGIAGLDSLQARRGKIIRPLLAWTKKELLDFAAENKIEFRTDSSNAGDDYRRNRIRHELTETLEKEWPSYRDTLRNSFVHLAEANALSLAAVNSFLATQEKNGIEIQSLENFPAPHLVLFQWLSDKGFSPSQISLIYANRHRQSGSFFESESHRLFIDRGFFRLEEKQEEATAMLVIESIEQPAENLVFEAIAGNNFSGSSTDAPYFDRNKLKFPLTWRDWLPGDRMEPMGMEGSKKISDMLVDAKIPRQEKKRVKVLISCGEIAWLPGIRISRKFLVDESTTQMIRISLRA